MEIVCTYCGKASIVRDAEDVTILLGRPVCRMCFGLWLDAEQIGAKHVLGLFHAIDKAHKAGTVRTKLNKIAQRWQADEAATKRAEEEQRLRKEAEARLLRRLHDLQDACTADEAKAQAELDEFLAVHPEYAEEEANE